jgi:hypothetical protein
MVENRDRGTDLEDCWLVGEAEGEVLELQCTARDAGGELLVQELGGEQQVALRGARTKLHHVPQAHPVCFKLAHLPISSATARATGSDAILPPRRCGCCSRALSQFPVRQSPAVNQGKRHQGSAGFACRTVRYRPSLAHGPAWQRRSARGHTVEELFRDVGGRGRR